MHFAILFTTLKVLQNGGHMLRVIIVVLSAVLLSGCACSMSCKKPTESQQTVTDSNANSDSDNLQNSDETDTATIAPEETTTELEPNTYPETLSNDELSGPVNEVAYDNIQVKMNKDKYSIYDRQISCTISDGNAGKAFYYHHYPLVEYKDGDNWVRLSYYPPESDYEIQWFQCYDETDKNKKNSTVVSFFPEYMEEDFVVGQYRLIIFIGPNTYYAEFEA